MGIDSVVGLDDHAREGLFQEGVHFEDGLLYDLELFDI